MTLGWNELSLAVKRRDTGTIVHRLPYIEQCLRRSPTLTRERVEAEMLQGRRLVLRPCPFPYNVDASHYILWVRDTITHVEAWRLLARRISLPFLLYENPSEFRSVPHTQHFHVFVRGVLE